MPLSVKKVEKLAQIITPNLHLRIEVGLGSSREGYIRPGVSMYRDKSGSRGWTVEIDSKDYLILRLTQEISRASERGERGRPDVLTVCLTQPLIPITAAVVRRCVKAAGKLFWLEDTPDGRIWVGESVKSNAIEVPGTKGNRRLHVYPELIEISPGSNSFTPGICMRATDSTRGKTVVVRLFMDEAERFLNYMDRLDLNAVGLQMVQIALQASAGLSAEGDEEFSRRLGSKMNALSMFPESKLMRMGEDELMSLASAYGGDIDWVPESLDHLRDGVRSFLKSIDKLKEDAPDGER